MKTDYQIAIIMTLKKLREEQGVTQAALAQFLDISPGQLGNIESCKQTHKYTLKQIVLLCRKFGYPIADLFMQKNDVNNNIDSVIDKIVEYEENKDF